MHNAPLDLTADQSVLIEQMRRAADKFVDFAEHPKVDETMRRKVRSDVNWLMQLMLARITSKEAAATDGDALRAMKDRMYQR